MRCDLLLTTTLIAALCGACDEKRPAPHSEPKASASPSATPSPKPLAHKKSKEEDEASAAAKIVADAGADMGPLQDVGAAAPATASERGVVFITKDDQVVLAELKQGGRLDAVQRGRDAFQVDRGPAVTATHAFFTTRNGLARRALKSPSPLQVLDSDGRFHTRAAVVPSTPEHPTLVAYLASGNKDSTIAKLWVEGGTSLTLTPDGSAASSVTLVPVGDDVLALSVEGRTGMTPVHARRISFDGKRPKLHEDVVVWVAGPAGALTEVTGVARPDGDLWGLLPMERDVTHFGLAQIHIGRRPEMGAPITWRPYPNGLDPAPTAAANACGRALAAYARPTQQQPGSPQAVHLASFSPRGLSPALVVAQVDQVANLSLSPVQDGVLIAYVADGRTWARVVHCTAPLG